MTAHELNFTKLFDKFTCSKFHPLPKKLKAQYDQFHCNREHQYSTKQGKGNSDVLLARVSVGEHFLEWNLAVYLKTRKHALLKTGSSASETVSYRHTWICTLIE